MFCRLLFCHRTLVQTDELIKNIKKISGVYIPLGETKK